MMLERGKSKRIRWVFLDWPGVDLGDLAFHSMRLM
jgi:hypothetical protein